MPSHIHGSTNSSMPFLSMQKNGPDTELVLLQLGWESGSHRAVAIHAEVSIVNATVVTVVLFGAIRQVHRGPLGTAAGVMQIQVLTKAVTIEPGVSSHHVHVSDAIALLEQGLNAVVGLHNLFCLHAVLNGDHRLHALNLTQAEYASTSLYGHPIKHAEHCSAFYAEQHTLAHACLQAA